MAKLTLEEINQELERQGRPLLEKLPGSEKAPITSATIEEEQKPPAGELSPILIEGQSPVVLTDEAVLQYLASKGIQANSVTDLKPKAVEEDPEVVAQRRESEKLAFALSKGLTNKKEYESFVQDVKDPIQLVFSQYVAEQKAEDPELTDEEITKEFNEKFGLDSDPGTRKNKRGQKEINILAEKILKNRHSKVYNIDSEFDRYESDQNSKKAQAEKLLTQTPLYKNDVENVFSELKTISSNGNEVEIPSEVLSQIKNSLLSQDHAKRFVEQGWTKEEIKEVALNTIYRFGFDKMAENLAIKMMEKNQKGVRGIMPLESQQRKTIGKLLSPEQQMMKDLYSQQAEQQVPTPLAN